MSKWVVTKYLRPLTVTVCSRLNQLIKNSFLKFLKLFRLNSIRADVEYVRHFWLDRNCCLIMIPAGNSLMTEEGRTQWQHVRTDRQKKIRPSFTSVTTMQYKSGLKSKYTGDPLEGNWHCTWQSNQLHNNQLASSIGTRKKETGITKTSSPPKTWALLIRQLIH